MPEMECPSHLIYETKWRSGIRLSPSMRRLNGSRPALYRPKRSVPPDIHVGDHVLVLNQIVHAADGISVVSLHLLIRIALRKAGYTADDVGQIDDCVGTRVTGGQGCHRCGVRPVRAVPADRRRAPGACISIGVRRGLTPCGPILPQPSICRIAWQFTAFATKLSGAFGSSRDELFLRAIPT